MQKVQANNFALYYAALTVYASSQKRSKPHIHVYEVKEIKNFTVYENYGCDKKVKMHMEMCTMVESGDLCVYRVCRSQTHTKERNLSWSMFSFRTFSSFRGSLEAVTHTGLVFNSIVSVTHSNSFHNSLIT